MAIYIALLRGINVNGQKIIKMDDLKSIFESMEFHRVTTYIQSGNVIFEAGEEKTSLIRSNIESRLKEVLGYEVTVIVRTVHEMEEIIKLNPYDESKLLEDEKLYLSFLSEEPTVKAIEDIMLLKNEIDDFQILNREFYILCRKGYGKSLYSNNFVEKKLKVAATTRNWQTVSKITRLGQDLLVL
jgi:uncharacterized protein (DUF1697 family)